MIHRPDQHTEHRIRPVTVADAPAVAALMGMGAPWIRPRTDSDYWMYASLFSSRCLVAVDSDCDAGLAAAVTAFRSQDNPSEIYVQDLITHPVRRRHGADRALITALTHQAVQWGCRSLYLTSEPANHAAHATWLSLGFANRPGDSSVAGVDVITDFKGLGKHRAVYDLRIE